MIHYHGTPITPIAKFYKMGGRCFCISYATPTDVTRAHEIGQSVLLDNGAFTFWRQGVEVSAAWWEDYAKWAEPWLDHPTTWAIIPDVIGGTEQENDALIFKWPRHLFKQSAPVWHMHESLDRLKYLCEAWPKVCIGSSGEYADPRSSPWAYRMDETFNAIIPNGGKPPTWIHMLRAMDQAINGQWPFASTDSTNAAQNHHLYNCPTDIASKIDRKQAPARWVPVYQTSLTF
jgi:hypothetical protein